MADSIREAITAAIHTLIDAGGKPAGLTIERGRVLQIDEGALPFTAVFQIQETESDEELDPVLAWDLEIGVETTVKAVGQSSDEELDPYLVWTHTAILADRRLGGLAQDVSLARTQWEREQLSDPFGRALQVVRVKYHTSESDPTSGAS